jgi:hypothetical protein
MPITTWADWMDGQNSGERRPFMWRDSNNNPLQSWAVRWPTNFTGPQGTPSTPSTAVAPDNTNALAVVPSPSAADQWLAACEIGIGNANRRITGGMVLCDVLSVQGGLSGTVASPTAQSTNLPTAALTRYTDGDGVMMGLAIYGAVGGTATTATVSYTDGVNGAGRTSTDIVFGGSNANTQGMVLILIPQAGDRNPVSVESVTLAATTGTAGNFGVVLFKPIAFLNEIGGTNSQREPYKNFIEGASSVSPETTGCLVPFFFGTGGTTGVCMVGGHVTYIQG